MLGPIDNTPLIEAGKLRRHHVDDIDYQLLIIRQRLEVIISVPLYHYGMD